VSHFYSGGDICDLTGKERQIEVKLKCKKADSPSTVTLYLLEPKTCEYVLGVESPLVCDILPHADENGMMPQGLLDSIDKDSVEEPEAIFTEDEERTFEELKQRHKSSSAESGEDGEQSSQVKTSQITKDSAEEPKAIFSGYEESVFKELNQKLMSSSPEAGEDGEQSSKVKTSQITKETVKIVDGVKITSKQKIINGKLVSSEVNEEYVGSKVSVEDLPEADEDQESGSEGAQSSKVKTGRIQGEFDGNGKLIPYQIISVTKEYVDDEGSKTAEDQEAQDKTENDGEDER